MKEDFSVKRVAVLCLLLLCWAVGCEAKEVDCGFFTADLPSGWTSQKKSPAVILVAPDKDTILTVAKAPTEGHSVKEIAEASCKEMKGRDFEDLGDDCYDYVATVDERDLYVQIYPVDDEGRECAVITRWGAQGETVSAIFDSIQMK